jgi:hypothetical protein
MARRNNRAATAVAKRKARKWREAVSSRAIRVLDYDGDEQQLDVEFREGGAVYRYYDVPSGSATRLRNASSIGRSFVKNVRLEYVYERIRAGRKRGSVKRKR